MKGLNSIFDQSESESNVPDQSKKEKEEMMFGGKVTIKGKVYALRDGKKQLLYDYESTMAGRPGNPIGEITLTPDGKKKIVFKK